jgi:hypothetical protein
LTNFFTQLYEQINIERVLHFFKLNKKAGEEVDIQADFEFKGKNNSNIDPSKKTEWEIKPEEEG